MDYKPGLIRADYIIRVREFVIKFNLNSNFTSLLLRSKIVKYTLYYISILQYVKFGTHRRTT